MTRLTAFTSTRSCEMRSSWLELMVSRDVAHRAPANSKV
ncbi:hypothetical protein STIAU_0372, partial [Stigmatella aurantiaca DW4/3-1]